MSAVVSGILLEENIASGHCSSPHALFLLLYGRSDGVGDRLLIMLNCCVCLMGLSCVLAMYNRCFDNMLS
jgi:hypothetical protein